MISVKALLDMTHQQCPGFVMVTVGMVVGMVLLQVLEKRTSPVRLGSSLHQSYPRSDIDEKFMLVG